MSKPSLDIAERMAELRSQYVYPSTAPALSCPKPPVITTYDESEFVRPRKVISNQCPCCGQPWKFPVNARMCPECGEAKYLHEFTNKTGMCKACKYARMKARKEKNKRYLHDYYLKKLKEKRKAKKEAAKLAANQQSVINE